MRAVVYDSPLTFDEQPSRWPVVHELPRFRSSSSSTPRSSRRSDAGALTTWEDLDAMFRASAAANAAERAAKEADTKAYVKKWAAAFDVALPGAGSVLLWAYDTTVAIGKAIYGDSTWNTDEAKARVKAALTGHLRWMIDPVPYDGELYAGAMGYADKLEWMLKLIDALAPAQRAELQRIADARIKLASAKDPTYLDLLGMPEFYPGPGSNAVPHAAYLLGTIAARLYGAPVDKVQKATVGHWEAQRSTARYSAPADPTWGRPWTQSDMQVLRYLENFAFAEKTAKALTGKSAPIFLLTPTAPAPTPVKGIPMFGKTLGGTPPGGTSDVPEPPTSKGKITGKESSAGVFVLLAGIGAALYFMSKGKI